MDGNGEKNIDFYQVLGLKKECTITELKNAYKKLALRWHPDRCSASGNSKYVEEAKKKFQAIQEAYSVLSDENKRFLYDVGIHDSDDDTDGMADFLSEMATMMNQNKPNDNVETSFEEIKDLFKEMFQSDIESFGLSSETKSFTSINKRSSSEMSSSIVEDCSNFKMSVQGFCLGMNTMEDTKRGERRGTKHGPKHRPHRNGVS
ncbi:unnamed protein product [Lactuca virosa]|uniref:J domain-containing protein n=1 Tax=Lactuca virosa TaxID=75947 RepID=A0AAU9MDZ4_9ASTR|nr:unnamed protein product [Lactuca virosa]